MTITNPNSNQHNILRLQHTPSIPILNNLN